MKQAVGLVKTEVCNLSEGEEGLELLAEVLVREVLLVPEKEFLDSLEEGERDPNGEVMVPRQLLLIWSEFVQVIDKGVGVRVLVEKLLEKQGVEGKEVCAAWVVILTEGMAGVRGDKVVTVGRDQLSFKTLEKWLDKRNMLVGQLCGLLCEVGGLGVGDMRRVRVEQLVRVSVGGKVDPIGDIYREREI